MGSEIWNRGSPDDLEPNAPHDHIPCETKDDELDEVADAKKSKKVSDILVPKDSNSWPWFD